MFIVADYDDGQLVLPFVERVYSLYNEYTPLEIKPYKPIRDKNRGWAFSDIPLKQYLFPFHQIINTKHFSRLAEYNYPTFDKKDDGSLYLLINHSASKEWVASHMLMRYYYTKNNSIYFESKHDYMVAMISGMFKCTKT